MPPRMPPLIVGDQFRELILQQRGRSYWAHLPPQYTADRAWPLILALHGGGTNAESMIALSGLNEVADQAGWIVIYPSGTGTNETALSWNAGSCCGYAKQQNIDDVGYLTTLLEKLTLVVNYNRAQVFVVGMSNGGMMALRFAAERADLIAGVASISGSLEIETLQPSRPVPLVYFHGTADEFVPYAGGFGPKAPARVAFRPVTETISLWTQANRCNPSPVVTELSTTVEDGTRVTRTAYSAMTDGAPVTLYTIHGGGHTWPGRAPRVPIVGASTMNLNAGEVLKDFFNSQCKSN